MNTQSINNAKPAVARNAGSQSSVDTLASPQAEGLAVMAPGAGKSAPAADDKDAVILALREAVEAKDKRIEAMEAELIYLRGVALDQANKIRTSEKPPMVANDELCTGLAA